MALLFLALIILCLASGIVLIVKGFGETQQESPESTAQRLARLRQRRDTRNSPADREHERAFARSEEQRAAAERPQRLPALSRFMKSRGLLWQLEEDLIQVRSTWRASELLVASVLLGLTVFIVFMLLGFGLLFAAPLGLCCLMLPWMYVRYLRNKYFSAFEEQLSDTLLLMANSLKAGFSFLQTMEMVGRESQPPISDEFARVVQEISVGVTVAQALQNLTVRVRSMDLHLMVTAVIIQREVGGGLAEILETIAEIIRERMRIKREIRVLTTQGKVSGGILALLPVAIGLLIHLSGKVTDPYAPSFVQPLLSDPMGIVMLAVAACLEVMGFLVIMRIVSIRV
jgi:tight adherence protein B